GQADAELGVGGYEPLGLQGQLAGERQGALILRVLALADRLDRDERERDDRDEQRPERDRDAAAAGGAVAAHVGVAGRQELALVAREPEGALLLPLARLEQVGPAVQPVVVAVVREPVGGS